MIEVLFPDEQTPVQLTDAELAMRKALAGVKLRNGRWDYTEAFRRRCAELRGEWAWTQERMRGPRREA
jgi:hypothetical protein